MSDIQMILPYNHFETTLLIPSQPRIDNERIRKSGVCKIGQPWKLRFLSSNSYTTTVVPLLYPLISISVQQLFS